MDDLNAEETSSESEDEDLNKVGKELRKMLRREEGEDSSEEDEEDPDSDDMKGTSALFLSGLSLFFFPYSVLTLIFLCSLSNLPFVNGCCHL